MTEQEFWNFLEESWEGEREPQISGRMDTADPEMQMVGRYFEAHVLLPKDYNKIPENKLIEMSELLFMNSTSLKTKEAVLIIMAHQNSKEVLAILEEYNKNPDGELKIFANLALSECKTCNS